MNSSDVEQREKLFTSSYVLACVANFLLFFSFYLILPIIPLYLIEEFAASKSMVGAVLSCYTISVLLIRPFSGFLLDITSRKPLYLISYFCIIWVYLGYEMATSIAVMIFIRLAHGLFFGTLTTASSTLVIDIMPSSRRGEGLGYFGVMNNLAMTFGPMIGMFLHDYYNYDIIFNCAIIACSAGLVVGYFIKAPKKPKTSTAPMSLDRFILVKGLRSGLSLMLLGIPYAMTTSYVAIFAKELNLIGSSALFFTFLAIGLIASRFFSGRQVDKGYLTKMIALGTMLVAISFCLLGSLKFLLGISVVLASVGYYISALLIGLSYGTIFPAYNTMFVNLAHHNQRGTASSTYMTSWDVGIGIGLFLGGHISQRVGFPPIYILGAFLGLISYVLFTRVVAPYFHQHKLR